MRNQEKKLYRSRTDRILLGVAGGLGRYFNLDATIFRIIFLVLSFNGFGIIVYLILSFIMPLEPENSPGSAYDSPAPEPAVNGEKIREFANEIGRRTKEMAGEWKEARTHDDGFGARNILGIAIVIIGLGLLLKQFFPFSFYWIGWGIIWPLVIVFLGFLIITKR